MNAEQIADELIAARKRRRPATKLKHLRPECEYVRVGALAIRKLSAAEIGEFRQHIENCVAACNARAFCWKPNCDRCKPA